MITLRNVNFARPCTDLAPADLFTGEQHAELGRAIVLGIPKEHGTVLLLARLDDTGIGMFTFDGVDVGRVFVTVDFDAGTHAHGQIGEFPIFPAIAFECVCWLTIGVKALKREGGKAAWFAHIIQHVEAGVVPEETEAESIGIFDGRNSHD